MKQVIALLVFAIFLRCALVTTSLSFISEVPDNARQNFSLNFFRNVYTNRFADYVVSPAGVQKFLVVLYDGSKNEMRHEILYDLCVKIIESYTLNDMVKALTKQVTREEAHRLYFENDFNEEKNNFEIKNYIIGTKNVENGFKITARNYFGVGTINRLRDAVQYDAVKQEFPEIIDENANLQIVSSIDFKANLQNNFHLMDGKLIGVGKFRYGTLQNMRILKLPLQFNENITLEIFLPNTEEYFNNFIDELGKNMKNMNEYDEKLELKYINVILPEFKYENVTDLTLYFKKYGTAMERMLSENIGMEYVSEDRNTGTKIDSFWQITKVHIKPTIENDADTNENTIEETTDADTFDATEKSFVYFIKSKDILYFAGVHYVPDKK